jgi:hypothetical protein
VDCLLFVSIVNLLTSPRNTALITMSFEFNDLFVLDEYKQDDMQQVDGGDG